MKAKKTGMLLAGGLVAAVLGAPGVLALELGELTVSSAINEPLAASIELRDVAGLEPGQIAVAFGDPAEFEQAGLEQALLLSGVRFAVETSGSTGVIRLSTADNIVEPFLGFILSARWPNGRQVREYTLLLDLPTFSQSPAPQPAPATAQGVAAAPVVAGAAVASHEVGAGETLWQIASNTRPDASVSMQQMMVAIQRANPDAFVDNDINRIRSGHVLRIPPLQDIAALPQDAAVAQVNQQDSTLGVQPVAAGGAAATAPRQQQDELTLLTGDEAAAPGGADTSELAATIAELESALMMSEESLDRARLEHEELTGRLASLEAEIVLLRNIIAVEDQLLAQLQQELAAQASPAAAPPQAEDAPASGLTGLLQNTVVLLGILLALVLAVVGLLVLKRRRAESEEQQRHDYDQFKDLPAGNTAADPLVTDTGLAAGVVTGSALSASRDDDAPAYYVDESIVDENIGTIDGIDVVDADAVAADPGFSTGEIDSSELDRVEIGHAAIGSADISSAGITSTETDGTETDSTEINSADMSTAVPEVIDIDFSAVPEPEWAYTLPDGIAEADQRPADTQQPDQDVFAFRPAPIQSAGDDNGLPDAGAIASNVDADAHYLFEDTMQFDDDEVTFEAAALSSQEEFDTKLDLATAFEAMGERDDALQILEEVIAEGNPQQVATALQLKQRWQSGS